MQSPPPLASPDGDESRPNAKDAALSFGPLMPERQSANWGLFLGTGLLIFFAAGALRWFSPGAMWALWIGVGVLCPPVTIVAALQLRSATKRLGAQLSSREDIESVTSLVSFNMRAAAFMIVAQWPLFWIALFSGEWLAMLLLSVPSLLLSRLSTSSEKKFRAMTPQGPGVAALWAELIQQWKESRLSLDRAQLAAAFAWGLQMDQAAPRALTSQTLIPTPPPLAEPI